MNLLLARDIARDESCGHEEVVKEAAATAFLGEFKFMPYDAYGANTLISGTGHCECNLHGLNFTYRAYRHFR